MWESIEIAGKTCHILQSGGSREAESTLRPGRSPESEGNLRPDRGPKSEGAPVFLWPFYPHEGGEPERLEAALQKVMPDDGFIPGTPLSPDSSGAKKQLRRPTNYTIAAWQVEDWNRDLSPWTAPMAMGGGSFSGGAPSVLGWLTAELLPKLKARYPEGRKYYLTGYSLAGLFALWSLYEADCFDGAVCCSGSLWLEGWDRYVLGHRIKAPADVYLSLGGREEKTRSPMMARVGDRTRAQEKILQNDPLVRRCTLEWNPGGHFADSAQRLAKGIRWICARP